MVLWDERRFIFFREMRAVTSVAGRDIVPPAIAENPVEPYAAVAASRKRADHKAGRK
jgi:hypothetical protein